MNYLSMNCPNCDRRRVELDSVCEKCGWDIDGDNYAVITRLPPCCIICKALADPLSGRCTDSHWHGLGGGPTTHEERVRRELAGARLRE